MKKFQLTFFILCFVISLFSFGCGHNNENEVGPAPASSVFIMAVTATGGDGSSNADFSLSIKKNPLPSIFPAVSVSENQIKLKVQPLNSLFA